MTSESMKSAEKSDEEYLVGFSSKEGLEMARDYKLLDKNRSVHNS